MDADFPSPPDDPEDWSDEQWIEYLDATDPEEALDSLITDSDPVTVMGKLSKTGSGQVLGTLMTTVGEIFYGEKNKPSIVEEAPGDSEDERVHRIELDSESKVARVFPREAKHERPRPFT